MATATIPAICGRSAKAPWTVSTAQRGIPPLTRDKTTVLHQPLCKEKRLPEAHMSPEEPKSQPQLQGDRSALLAEQKALGSAADIPLLHQHGKGEQQIEIDFSKRRIIHHHQ